jgi:hypothetical protein
LPEAADSNGNGVSDWDEANFNHSDLLAGSVGAFVTIGTLSGDSYTASFGSWEKQSGQAHQRSRRGSVTYPVSVRRSGVHALKFTVSSRLDGGLDEGYDFRVSLNGKPISYQTITIPEDGTSVLALLTPWLNAGDSYEFELFVDNSYNFRHISVDKVDILSASGVDSNANGIPDWVEIRLGASNGFDRVEVRSQTSPATVEGRARYFDLLNTHGVAVTKAPNGRFYAEVPLVSGEVRTLGFDFENRAVSQTATVRWEPTNVLQNPGEITVRQGDSLLLTAMRKSTEAAQESYTLTVGGQTIRGNGEQSSPVAFTVAGKQIIQLTHNGASGTVTNRTVSVTVLPRVAIDSPTCVTTIPRRWTHSPLPAGANLQIDDSVASWRESSANTFSLISTIPQDQPLLVRCGTGGPILGGGVVKSIRIRSHDLTGNITESYAAPIAKIRLPVVVTGDMSGIEIRCDIKIGGVIFTDGTITKNLYGGDLDGFGAASLLFLKPDGAHSNCRKFSVWKDGACIAEF